MVGIWKSVSLQYMITGLCTPDIGRGLLLSGKGRANEVCRGSDGW